MPPKPYPNLPESPQPVTSKPKAATKQIDPVEEDLPKYNIVRSALGTGIMSSVCTLSGLIFLNEIRFFLYYKDYLFMNPFGNYMFTAGFLISALQFFTFACVLFVPTYLLTGKKIVKLSPLIISIILQLFMLSFNNTEMNLRAFRIQNNFDKFLIIKNLAMTYGAFFGSCFLFFGLNSSYESKWNQMLRPFEYADYSGDSAV